MARRVLTTTGVAERLLATKLQLLNVSGARRPSLALSILTGASPAQPGAVQDTETMETTHLQPYAAGHRQRASQRFDRHTVYLSERQIGDVDRIAEACQRFRPRRISRSAVVRRAVEYLRAAVERDTDSATRETILP